MRARTLHLPANFKSVAPAPNACDFKCGFKCELELDRVFLPVRGLIRCEVCLRYFTKSLRAMVFMQTVYSTVVRGYS